MLRGAVHPSNTKTLMPHSSTFSNSYRNTCSTSTYTCGIEPSTSSTTSWWSGISTSVRSFTWKCRRSFSRGLLLFFVDLHFCATNPDVWPGWCLDDFLLVVPAHIDADYTVANLQSIYANNQQLITIQHAGPDGFAAWLCFEIHPSGQTEFTSSLPRWTSSPHCMML